MSGSRTRAITSARSKILRRPRHAKLRQLRGVVHPGGVEEDNGADGQQLHRLFHHVGGGARARRRRWPRPAPRSCSGSWTCRRLSGRKCRYAAEETWGSCVIPVRPCIRGQRGCCGENTVLTSSCPSFSREELHDVLPSRRNELPHEARRPVVADVRQERRDDHGALLEISAASLLVRRRFPRTCAASRVSIACQKVQGLVEGEADQGEKLVDLEAAAGAGLGNERSRWPSPSSPPGFPLPGARD